MSKVVVHHVLLLQDVPPWATALQEWAQKLVIHLLS